MPEQTGDGPKNATLRLFQIVRHDQELVGRLLRERPPQRHGRINGRLAAFLWTAVDGRVVGQPAVVLKGKRRAQDLSLVGAQREGMAKLVEAELVVDEGDDVVTIPLNRVQARHNPSPVPA